MLEEHWTSMRPPHLLFISMWCCSYKTNNPLSTWCLFNNWMIVNQYEKGWLPYLRVWYGHTFRLHCGPASHTRGDVRVASPRAWWQVSASLLQWQFPPAQVRPQRVTPLRLSRAIPHPVRSWAVWVVFGCHRSHGVCETAALFVRVRVQPLTGRIAAHSHGRRGGGSGVEAGGGESSREDPPALMWPGPVCGCNVQGLTRTGKTEKGVSKWSWVTIYST